MTPTAWRSSKSTRMAPSATYTTTAWAAPAWSPTPTAVPSQLHLRRLRQTHHHQRHQQRPVRLHRPIHRHRHRPHLPARPLLRSGHRTVPHPRSTRDSHRRPLPLRGRHRLLERPHIAAEGRSARHQGRYSRRGIRATQCESRGPGYGRSRRAEQGSAIWQGDAAGSGGESEDTGGLAGQSPHRRTWHAGWPCEYPVRQMRQSEFMDQRMTQTFRSRSQAITVAAILVTVGLVGLQGAIASFVGALDQAPGSVIGWGLFLTLGVAMWCCGLRLLFSCVQLSPRGVMVRNVFRTWRLGWEEVDAFSGNDGIVVLHLRNGEEIPITSLSGANILFRPKQQFVPDMAAKLNARADQLTSARIAPETGAGKRQNIN
jgi:hypothetical protein